MSLYTFVFRRGRGEGGREGEGKGEGIKRQIHR